MDFLIGLGIVVVIFILSGIKVINQYERGVILTLGKFTGIRQPGLRIVVPIFQKMVKVDQRTNTIDIPKQEVITKDNVTVNVDAVVYFRVNNAEKAILEVANYVYASSQFAQAALRDVTGNVDLDSLLGKRDEVSQRIEEIVDVETEKWGIDIENVKIQNIELPQDMKRAMAKQAEAERERRAVVISADGERQAAKGIADAAATLAKSAGGMTIRTLQTLEKVSSEPSQKTLVVIPSDMASSSLAQAITMSEAGQK
ncbi:MAG TPA: SPFH domain-containing protein [Candidatus Saccharimonadaceae bacterium]|nr:SPFH domain-containing protein [Candidatus Saccharimonadaceae bacterium]